jgi:hypothetical protein
VEDRLRETPDPRLRDPGEQPASEIVRQLEVPRDAVAVDRDHDLAMCHRDGRGPESGDLDGSEACGYQSEDGSIAQPHGSAGAHPAGIDARQESVCLFGIETHQCGSNPAGAGICGFWGGRFSIVRLPFF